MFGKGNASKAINCLRIIDGKSFFIISFNDYDLSSPWGMTVLNNTFFQQSSTFFVNKRFVVIAVVTRFRDNRATVG